MSYTFVRRLSPRGRPATARYPPTMKCECGHDVATVYHCCPACARPLRLTHTRADLAAATLAASGSPLSMSSTNRKLVSFASGRTKMRRAKSAAPSPLRSMDQTATTAADRLTSQTNPSDRPQLASPSTAVPCHHCSAAWPPQRHLGERPLHPQCYDLLAADSPSFRAGTAPSPARPRSPLPRLAPPGAARQRPSFASIGGVDGYLRREVQYRLGSAQAAFELFDRDRDGVINLADFEHAVKHTFGMGYLTRVEVSALMSRLDRNADGVIDPAEFQQFLRPGPVVPVPEVALQHTLAKLRTHLELRHHTMKGAFQALDLSHTGYLQLADFRRILNAAGMQLQEEELVALFDKLDSNHDGRVTHTEFMQVMAS